MISTAFSGLNISTALASPGDSNFIPDSWPPSPDFPICLSSKETLKKTSKSGEIRLSHELNG